MSSVDGALKGAHAVPSASPTLASGLGVKDGRGIDRGRMLCQAFDAEPVGTEREGFRVLCSGSLAPAFFVVLRQELHIFHPCYIAVG